MSPTQLRAEYLRYIDEHKYLPEHMKKEIKGLIAQHFNVMGATLGLIELTYRRTKDHPNDT